MNPPHADRADPEPDMPEPEMPEAEMPEPSASADGDPEASGTDPDDDGILSRKGRERLSQVISRTLQDEAFVHPHVKGLSDLLAEATLGHATYITLEDLLHGLSARGLAPVVLVVSLLNAVALIPGSTAILGLPLLFLGVSLMIGARTLWLPRKLRRRTFEREKLEAMINRVIPYVQKLERLAHPRYWPGTSGVIDRVYGAFVFCLGTLVTLPIPLGNMLPAFSIALVSLGIMARDGVWVLVGVFLATLSLGVVLGVAGAVTLAGSHVIGG